MSNLTTIDIWPGLAPGETTAEIGTRTQMYGRSVLIDVTRPQLTIYPLGNDKLYPTVLILPGGGYAEWLNSFGFAAAVLTYRIPKKRDAAFADALRAMRILRSRSAEFGIDPHALGVLGFSAGGHLAARLSSRYAYNGYALLDSIDSLSARPDFALPIYPAYLIGKDGAPPDDVRPHKDQPPLFLMQTEDDHVYCAKDYDDAASAAGVNTRALIYEKGGHGYGLEPDPSLPVSNWPKEAEKWLKELVH
jgi:acetyl esterase/lipase